MLVSGAPAVAPPVLQAGGHRLVRRGFTELKNVMGVFYFGELLSYNLDCSLHLPRSAFSPINYLGLTGPKFHLAYPNCCRYSRLDQEAVVEIPSGSKNGVHQNRQLQASEDGDDRVERCRRLE
jgi:hypothetical protein